MTKPLILKRVDKSPSGEWSDDDFEVLAEGVLVGRIMKAHAAPEGSPEFWTLAASSYHYDRTPTHGYDATRSTAMAAFAKSGRVSVAKVAILEGVVSRLTHESGSSFSVRRLAPTIPRSGSPRGRCRR